MNHEELAMKRFQVATDACVNTFDKKKEIAFKVLNSVCDEKTRGVFKEELDYLFDILGELPLEIEPYQSDKRFINFIHDQEVVGALAIYSDSLEYYFDIYGQYVSFKLGKFLDEHKEVKYKKEIYVDGREEGKYSSELEERDLPEITKMIYQIEEIIDKRNRVVEQNFILKEASCDIKRIDDEILAEEVHELHVTRYNSIMSPSGEIKVYAECPRGFSSAIKVTQMAKLPKAKIEFKEDYLPFSILSNLEFCAKLLLCSEEFKGFKVQPIIDDCDDKYIYLAKINLDLALEDEEIEFIPENIEVGECSANKNHKNEEEQESIK